MKKAEKKEIASVYLSGLIQGIGLVAFPAASTIFTSPAQFNFSNTAYGALFVPEAALSIGASFLSSTLSKHLGIKKVFLLGLLFNLLSMILLGSSYFFMGKALAYPLLLFATACLGVGFGLTVPCLNTLAALLFPKKVDFATLILNTLLGLGTALAPLLIIIFVGLGIWWGLPLLLSVFLLALLFFTLSLAFNKTIEVKREKKITVPPKFYLFALFIVLYGIVETVNGNWATIYMHKDVGVSPFMASFALTAFWSMATLGRLFFASIEKIFPTKFTYRALPFLLAAIFLFISKLSPGQGALGILLFGLAGLGCSALLPLTISFGNEELPSMKASIAGALIALYLLGYGIGAFGVGPLETFFHINLSTIFALSACVALLCGILSFFIKRRKT